MAAVLVLVLGGILRPRPRPEQPPPVETDIARLGRLAERRTLESASTFFAQLGDDVAPGLAWIDGPGLTGVAWEAQVVVTARFGSPSGSLSVSTMSGSAPARRGDWSPDSPVATVRADATRPFTPPVRAPLPAAPGAPVIAVWQSERGHVFAPATYIAESGLVCAGLPGREVGVTVPLTRAMSGGGVFDLDGGLLGVILPCGSRFAAVVPEAVDEWLRMNVTAASRLVARYGVTFEPLTPAEADFFKASSGAVVRELRAGGAAAAAGLRPGDIVVAVDGTPVGGRDDLRSLVGPVIPATVRLSVRRGPSPMEIEMASDGTSAPDAEIRDVISADPPPATLRIEALSPYGPLASAGLRVGDRVVRVGAREHQSPEQIRAALLATTGPPVFVEYERAGHRRGVLVVRGRR